MSLIHQEIYKVRSKIEVKKDKKNPHFGNTYMSLNSVLDALDQAIKGTNVTYGTRLEFRETASGGLVFLIGRVYYNDGDKSEMIESTIPLLNQKGDMQGMGSAITYATRYVLCSLFGLVGEEDDDGNGANKGNFKPRPELGVGGVSSKQKETLQKFVKSGLLNQKEVDSVSDAEKASKLIQKCIEHIQRNKK